MAAYAGTTTYYVNASRPSAPCRTPSANCKLRCVRSAIERNPVSKSGVAHRASALILTRNASRLQQLPELHAQLETADSAGTGVA
ncbi:hypothetical protein KCP77_07120 [Salmonella enterica subsp. enterica]|nr:hypothetical protein KCP77_07120 [Salmonella enterica subsp. enterica]